MSGQIMVVDGDGLPVEVFDEDDAILVYGMMPGSCCLARREHDGRWFELGDDEVWVEVSPAIGYDALWGLSKVDDKRGDIGDGVSSIPMSLVARLALQAWFPGGEPF